MVDLPHVESATVMLMIGAGSRYEKRELGGLSHFLEHMAFKGSQKRPSALLISSTIDGIGGEFNAFTSKDHTGFYIKAAAKHVSLLVDVLSDMILRPLLKPEEIEREKGVIIEEINMYADTPMRHIGDVFDELMFGDTPLGRDTAGKPEIVKKLRKNDFLDYMDGLYRPNNAVLIVAGGIGNKRKEVMDLANEQFGAWEEKEVWRWEKNHDSQNQAQVHVEHKTSEQAHIALGVRGYKLGDARRYALHVLSVILGGGMSSRLFIEVREKRGLAYYVHSGVELYLDTGNFVTQAGVDVKRVAEAIAVILKEYSGIKDGTAPIQDAELKKAKESIKGHLILELEDSRDVATFYATQQMLKREIVMPDEYMQRIDNVTIKEVEEVAREIFNEKRMNLAIIGPYKEEEKFKKLLRNQ